MKKVLCILAVLIILLAGCSYTGEQPGEQAKPQQSEKTERELLDAAAEWLEKDFSFTMDYQYMNLAINGMRQRSEQIFGQDGSWSMVTERESWDHRTDYRQKEASEFYYRYEDSQLVCYYSIAGEEPQRDVITDSGKKEMEDSKALLVGVSALMPDYLEGLYVTQPTGNDAVTILAYWLPVDQVMADRTMLSAFVNNAFAMSGNTYPSDAKAGILVLFEMDAQTYCPIAVSYMFHEVKPYVLSSGALSGEYALNADFMIMSYTFDFNIPDTIEVPEEMVP